MAYTPDSHYSMAQACLDEIATRKDDPEFNEATATLLLRAAPAHSLQGLLSAKIHDSIQ